MDITQTEMAERNGSTESQKFLTFNLDENNYGIPILKVSEIIGLIQITPMPKVPYYMKGVINLRGSVLPVIDLRTRLGLVEAELGDAARIIVIIANDTTVGFIVDEVVEVTTINTQNIEVAHALSTGLSTEYISGIAKADNRLFIMLNPDSIVNILQA